MRIAKIADIPPTRNSGMGRAMHESADALRALGHEVDLLLGAEVLPISDQGDKGRHLFFGKAVVETIRRRKQEGVSYDVVEIHEASAEPYCRAWQKDPSLPPVVILSHGLEEIQWELRLAMDRRKGRRTSLVSRVSTPLTRLRPIRYALRHCHQVICINSADRRYLEERLHLPAERITLGGNGVSPLFLQQPERVMPSEGTAQRLLFVGTWLERKGCDLVVSIFTEIHRTYPNIRLDVIGTGVPEEMVKTAFPASVRDNVQVRSHVKDEELISFYRKDDIFFFPAFLEPWGLVLAEAAASGMPILTTDAGGPADLFADGATALLMPPGDEAALITALKQLIEDANLRQRLGLAAQKEIQSYTWEAVARQQWKAYEMGIEQAKRGTG